MIAERFCYLVRLELAAHMSRRLRFSSPMKDLSAMTLPTPLQLRRPGGRLARGVDSLSWISAEDLVRAFAGAPSCQTALLPTPVTSRGGYYRPLVIAGRLLPRALVSPMSRFTRRLLRVCSPERCVHLLGFFFPHPLALREPGVVGS